MDNRDDDGNAWEITNSPDLLAEYLDGPVRRDLSASADESDLDDLIAAFRTGDLYLARSLGGPFGIYVAQAAADDETADRLWVDHITPRLGLEGGNDD